MSGNYISKIRSKLGNDTFNHPTARIIIENDKKGILFIQKMDTGNIDIPAGGFKEDETIEEYIIREVYEETGLRIPGLEVIGISSNPVQETVSYNNGNKVQYFTIEFYSNHWEGTINIQDTKEIKKAKFMSPEWIEELPSNELSTFESLACFKNSHKVMFK